MGATARLSRAGRGRSRRAFSAASPCCGTCPDPISIAHASLAQIVFCLTVAIALVTSPGWHRGYARHGSWRRTTAMLLQRIDHRDDGVDLPADRRSARRCATPTRGWRFRTSRWAFGHLIPPHWTPKIAIHFAHRVGALVVTALIAGHGGPRLLPPRAAASCWRPSILLLVLLCRADHARRADRPDGEALHHQFAARRHRRVCAGDVAGADAARAPRAVRVDVSAAEVPASAPPASQAGPAGSRGGTRAHEDWRLPAAACRGRPRPRVTGPRRSRRGASSDFVTLTKPRLNLLVLVTTLAGLYLASPTACRCACWCTRCRHRAGGRRRGGAQPGVGAPHRRADAAHAQRPLPGGRLRAAEGTWFGVVLSAVGLARAGAWRSTSTAAGVAGVTLVSYVLVYTPLKTRTSLSTLVGAVPGALPPVIGWSRGDRRDLAAGARAVRHRVLLADAALPGDRLDVPRRLRARRHSAAAGRSSRTAAAPASRRCSTPPRCGR